MDSDQTVDSVQTVDSDQTVDSVQTVDSDQTVDSVKTVGSAQKTCCLLLLPFLVSVFSTQPRDSILLHHSSFATTFFSKCPSHKIFQST